MPSNDFKAPLPRIPIGGRFRNNFINAGVAKVLHFAINKPIIPTKKNKIDT